MIARRLRASARAGPGRAIGSACSRSPSAWTTSEMSRNRHSAARRTRRTASSSRASGVNRLACSYSPAASSVAPRDRAAAAAASSWVATASSGACAAWPAWRARASAESAAAARVAWTAASSPTRAEPITACAKSGWANRTNSSSIEITPSARAGSSAATAPGSARWRVARVGSDAAAASRSARRVGAGRAPIRAATSPPIVLGTGRGAPGVTVAPCLMSDRAISSA